MICESFAYPVLMKYFEEISAIPRPSYHEERIADYLVAFAAERGLECKRDSVGNVLINLPASKGREDSAAILLQGHTDMVCEKNNGVEHDFMKDPLKLYVKDGWLRAEGTTLGADNGVAVAVMLALLDGASESHPALQCLFTVSEEVGLDGAKAFDYSNVYATKMVNMDSADESTVIVGCAGGVRSSLKLTVCREESAEQALRLHIGGLFGGHSGEDIDKNRANANKLMGRTLAELLTIPTVGSLKLASIGGGSKDNAIPRESEAVICVENAEAVKAEIARISREIAEELGEDDAGFFLTSEASNCEIAPMSAEDSRRVISLLNSAPNGIFARNNALACPVEFSRNLGVIRTEGDEVELVFASRSARESQINASIRELDSLASLAGASAAHYNRYPGWSFAKESEIREQYAEAYRRVCGGTPHLEVIHAGLECGLIKEALPHMDMLSCGPIVRDLHSPDEALKLDSFERFFAIILELMRIA